MDFDKEIRFSYFLLILCLNALSVDLTNAVERKQISECKLGRTGVTLSHLYFVDDTILFSAATPLEAIAL